MVLHSNSKLGVAGSKIYYRTRIEKLNLRRIEQSLLRAHEDRPLARSNLNSCSLNGLLNVDNQIKVPSGGLDDLCLFYAMYNALRQTSKEKHSGADHMVNVLTKHLSLLQLLHLGRVSILTMVIPRIVCIGILSICRRIVTSWIFVGERPVILKGLVLCASYITVVSLSPSRK